MENSEENQQYILDLASLYLNSKNYNKALEALDQAEEFYGVVAQLSFQKQKIYLQKNDLDGAVKEGDRKSTRLNSSHVKISYAVFCLKKKKINRSKNR